MLRGYEPPHIAGICKTPYDLATTALPSLQGMDHSAPARATPRRTPRIVLAAMAVVLAVLVGAIGDRMLTSSSSAKSLADGLLGTRGDASGEADGEIPDGAEVEVSDVEVPAVGNLDPDLLDALQLAAADAAVDGVEILVNSGWRSPALQAELLQDAIAEYGSPEAAAHWVATPETSAHVSGDAVDLGPDDATAWLSRHGAAYGLCQTYANEPWHYERRPEAVTDGCPSMFADPTEDPRMQP
jgi:zinc D-Ala-D-Ala carboxypeptidase